MKLEKRMIAYLVLAVAVGLFATFNKENGSIYMGFMILSFTTITLSVRATYLLVLDIARKFESDAKNTPQNATTPQPKQSGSKAHIGGDHGRASVQ
jgi:hypothetical protein